MTTPAPEAWAVELDAVSFSYPPSRALSGLARADSPALPALDRVTLRIRQGERLGVLGPNGGGKSTLLKLCMGVLTGYSGRILVLGRSPAQARRDGLIGYVPQRLETELAFPLSVRQVVAMTAERRLPPWRPADAASRRRVVDALELVGAAALAERPIGTLSGGQIQRVMIARALAAAPRILFLDEPTVGIDPAGQSRFAELLRSLHASLGLTVVVVSHDIRTVAAGCDRVACLSRTLHYHDAPGGLTPRVLGEVFQHDVAAIFGDLHVHAHPAAECRDPDHHHDAPASEPRSHAP